MKRALVAAALLLGTPAVARADLERFAVVIGDNRGAAGEIELQYAEDDAGKLADVLQGVGGIAPENTVLLRGRPARDVRRSLIAINERVRARTGAGRQTMLLVYYSGHADGRSLHLDGDELELDELERLVRGSAATFRLLILDSCRSGALTRVKGGRSAPPVALRLTGQLAGEGVVFLTSSAAREDAQESDELRGSFFTHYLVSGLLGAADQDGDGRIGLKEAYRYAFDQTVLASSRTLAGIQHPTFRYELAGQGDVILTEIRATAGRGRVSFPTGNAYVVARRDTGAVVAELAAHGGNRTLSLEPGTYLVRGRARRHLLEGSLRVAAGASTTLDDASLERIEYARLVRKGGTSARAAHGPALGTWLRTPIIDGAGVCLGGIASYPIALRSFTVAPRVAACRGRFENDVLAAHTDALDLQVRLTHAWDFPWVTLDLGVAAGGELLREGFHDTRARADARTSAAGHLDVTAGAEVDIARGIYLGADVAAQSHFFRVAGRAPDEGEPEPTRWVSRFALAGALLVGWRL